MDRYVAEIDLPAPVYMPARPPATVLSNPGYFGCVRGYWKLYSHQDVLGTARPLGIRLTAELAATDREDAEDVALQVGLQFAQVLTVYSGSPLPVARLNRLGRIGESEGLLEQYDYYYLDWPEALPRVMLRQYDLEKLLGWFGSLDENTTYHLELASRWYGMSVGAEDPLDGYLAAWIGLESVGSLLGARVHESGSRAICKVCGNPPGIKRNNGDAGIEHAIKEVAPELLKSRTLKELKDVRNDIAHCLKPVIFLRRVALDLLPDLQLSLKFAILAVARPTTLTPGSGNAILPRDFKTYPDARHGIRSAVELIQQTPYYGGWLNINRQFVKERSRVEADGSYIWGFGIRVGITGLIPVGAPEIEKEYVIFQRLGRSWEQGEIETDLLSIQVVPWRAMPVSPAWQRHLSNQGD